MITTIDQVMEFPLTWPENKPRAAKRERSPFYGTTLPKSMREIGDEMRRYRAIRFIVSMAPAYRRTSSDPAVAVWFEIGKRGSPAQLRVIACDKYATQEDNAHAVALTLQGLRAFERYGTYSQEQALEGARAALPPPAGAAEIVWRTVLGDVPPGVDKSDALLIVNGRYRRLSADAQGNEQEQRRLNLAIEAARREFGS